MRLRKFRRRDQMPHNENELGKISVATIVILAIIALAAVVGGVAIANGSSGESDEAEQTESNGEEPCEGEEGEECEEEEAPVPVDLAEATTDTVASWITATANLVAENEVQVIAESDGRVASFNFEEGQRVQRGQVMATLVGDEARIALAKARARAENAKAAYDRAEGLYNQDLIPRGDFDKTAMERRVADQDLAEAEWRLSRKAVRAPISGVVTLRMVQNGQQVNPGDQLYTITDFDPLIADLYLPEREAMALTLGRTVRITPKANETIRFDGRIRRISPVVDTATGTVKVTVETTDVPDSVRPGTFVQVGIVREEHKNAVVIPRDAVIRELARSFVFVEEDGLAKRRIIETGIEDGELVEVLDGISPGDKVVVAGQGGLKNDTKIKVAGAAESTETES